MIVTVIKGLSLKQLPETSLHITQYTQLFAQTFFMDQSFVRLLTRATNSCCAFGPKSHERKVFLIFM